MVGGDRLHARVAGCSRCSARSRPLRRPPPFPTQAQAQASRATGLVGRPAPACAQGHATGGAGRTSGAAALCCPCRRPPPIAGMRASHMHVRPPPPLTAGCPLVAGYRWLTAQDGDGCKVSQGANRARWCAPLRAAMCGAAARACARLPSPLGAVRPPPGLARISTCFYCQALAFGPSFGR